MQAIWNETVIAENDDTVVVESNHYFPAESLNKAYFIPSDMTTHCPWKGNASYYHVVVDGKRIDNAAWYYPEPKTAAAQIKGRVAFWRSIKVA